MNTQWNYVLKLSLRDIALRRVVINVCSGPDILPLIEKFQIKSIFFNYENKRREIYGDLYSDILFSDGEFEMSIVNEFENEWLERIVKDQISDLVSKLLAPKLVEKQIVQFLKFTGLQIVRWKVFHENYLTSFSEELGVPILSKLCWNYLGMVDYRKTAEALIRCELLDAGKLYKLACLYCLEDYILLFWEKLPEEIKMKFYNDEGISKFELPQLWPYILKGKQSTMSRKYFGLLSFNLGAFKIAACSGNKAATEYFFRKLTLKEKETSLCEVVGQVVTSRFSKSWRFQKDFLPENFSEVFFYLLSQMNYEQQMQVFKEKPSQVLCCFLDWPWKDLFLEHVDQIWAFVSENCYNNLFSFMQDYFTNSMSYMSSRFCFPMLFQELFMRSPNDFRIHFIREESRKCTFIWPLFNNGDTGTIKVILRKIDYTDRFKLLSYSEFFKLCCIFILEHKLHMVKVCIEEAMLSKEDMKRLENAFMMFVTETRPFSSLSEQLSSRFFQLLREINASAESKRNSRDENQTEAKKLRKNS